MSTNSSHVRTRVAPSPTGYPHIGTMYQALFDKAYAVKMHGKFIMRVEDTDRTRYVADAEESLHKAFAWFGLIPDESPENPGEYGPYKQSERLELYKEFADRLIQEGAAYYCFCSKERLEEVRNKQQKAGKSPMYDKKCRHLPLEEVKKRLANGDEHVIRMKIPENTVITVTDLLRGDISFDSDTIDDQVIMKADGFPTYHLALIVDDFLMKISHVIRGPEWIPSFPKHKLLYDYFEIEMPIFVHTPLIANMDGSKLSKRQGHSSVDWYRRKGFLPEAVLNFMCLLGWSHPDQKEIFDFKEFVEKFDLSDIATVSPKFDLQKLEWMNGQYLQNLDDAIFVEKLNSWLDYSVNSHYKGAAPYDTKWTSGDYEMFIGFLRSCPDPKLFASINKERVKKFEDILELNSFFIKDFDLDANVLYKQKSKAEITEHLQWVYDLLDQSKWTLKDLKNVEKEVSEKASKLGWKVGEVFYPIRVAVAGSPISPPLFESIYLLGIEKTLERLKTAIHKSQ